MKCKILLTAAVLLLGGCGPKEVPLAGSQLPDQEIPVSLNQTVAVTGKNQVKIGEVTLTDLQDSRCPAQARCIRQGAAVATFRVRLPGIAETQVIRLFVGDFMADDPRNKRNLIADTATVTTGRNTRYQLILKQVTPYPGSGSENPQAVIQLNQN